MPDQPEQPKKSYTPQETSEWNAGVRKATIKEDRKRARKTADLLFNLFELALDAYKLPGTSKATREQLYVYQRFQRRLLTHTRTADVEFDKRWQQSLVSRGLREPTPKRPVVRDGNFPECPGTTCTHYSVEHIHLPPKHGEWQSEKGKAEIAALQADPMLVKQLRLHRKQARARSRGRRR